MAFVSAPQYKKYNLFGGWLVFLVAATTYLLTLEPSVSLWDCGEFIASSYKLQVGHPPGAPFFMLMARFFTFFTADVSKVALMVNALSALASAFTILFLFWTITHMVRKLLSGSNRNMTTAELITIIASGLTGALAYTFSDTFWFSAVEAEVYATSSLFTAVVFWAILKWENVADHKYANRWLILIAYLMGLSIGVHLLNLLAIPAIVMVYYFRKYKVTRMGVIRALGLGFLLLGILMYLVIPGVVKLAAWFELFFVNGLGLPFKSGVLLYIVVLTTGIIYGIWVTHKRSKVVLNTILVAFTVILIGYSSYAAIVIRSLANPPMDENNPEQVFSLLAYLNREQYGDRPLINGQYYNAPVKEYKEGKPTRAQVNGKYEITSHKTEIVYDNRFTTFFPRMYSSVPQHVQAYKDWASIEGVPVRVINRQGQQELIRKPTFGENLLFFFKYQLGHMYFRYFMWNFSGKQNDNQSHGGILDGNWISGIPALDQLRLGSQQMPPSIKDHPARNTYFLFPFLLGFFGLLFHASRKSKDFWVVMLLFFFTGIAIVIYLNQTPIQPRERDYAYAGSFYAFAIWIGIGVAALVDVLPRSVNPKIRSAGAGLLALILVPGLMASQNWDDHDRSGRTFARDMAFNYLNSCAPNAILFTHGDNDTFPLWYAQEVEGIRTDVRVVNLMLLNADWYIEMMKRKAYDSEALPVSFSNDELRHGNLNSVFLIERVPGFVELGKAIQFVASNNPETKRIPNNRGSVDHLPAKKFRLDVDTFNVLANGTIDRNEVEKMLPALEWSIDKNRITKSELVALDILANNNWERPVYFASGGNNSSLSLEDYFQLEGFAYRLVPFKTSGKSILELGSVDDEFMSEKYLNGFRWGGLGDMSVYFDSHTRRTVTVMRVRGNFARLAEKLLDEGDTARAITTLDKAAELMPKKQIPYDLFTIKMAECFYRAGENTKGHNLARDFAMQISDELEYYVSLNDRLFRLVDSEIRMNLQYLQNLAEVSNNAGDTELAQRISNALGDYYQIYQERD